MGKDDRKDADMIGIHEKDWDLITLVERRRDDDIKG